MYLKNPENPLSKTKNLITQELSNELLIYDLDINKAFSLNEVATLVWLNCDGTKSINDIAAVLQSSLDKSVNNEIVWLTLSDLKKQGLVSFESAPPQSIAGLTRREVVKQIGLSSMIALPLVSALVAPTAANAASTGDVCDPGGTGGIGNDPNKTRNGGACNGHGNCCSNKCCLPAGGGQGICRAASTVC